MQTIHPLPSELVAKIAAGEVVERPAYAVKELLDNAIDAQATEIFLDIQESGLKKISITDNGIGMSKEDLRECFKPHTTSKIKHTEDLFNIRSLGFRGEALWSISSISAVIIKSRPRDSETGFALDLQEGEINSFTQIGMPHGTRIEIFDLFKSVPARLKFMRSLQTEFRHIFDIVTSFALAYPHIGFILKHNNKTILNFAPHEDRAQRAGILFGSDLYENLIPLNHTHEFIQLHGFVTKPQAAVNSQLKQFIFVNNRRIYDRIIASTIKQAYGTLLEPKIQPAFLLFIDLPPERVDINIHPRKEQVAFAETALISKAVTTAVVQSLSQQNIAYHDLRWKRGEYINHTPVAFSLREGKTDSYAAKLLKEQTEPWNVNKSEILKSSDIIQIHNTFIILQTKSGLLMIDQHAAHERILYEQFLDAFQTEVDKKETYNLEKPELITLGLQGAQTIHEHLSELEKIGFEIEEYGQHEFVIKSAPLIYKDKDLTQLIVELLEDMNSHNPELKVDSQSNKMLSFLACRSAIKAGDKLTKEQARNLIEKLQQSNIKYTCPHGRPVQVELSLREIQRLFHRV